jgi:hypothetical protein
MTPKIINMTIEVEMLHCTHTPYTSLLLVVADKVRNSSMPSHLRNAPPYLTYFLFIVSDSSFCMSYATYQSLELLS